MSQFEKRFFAALCCFLLLYLWLPQKQIDTITTQNIVNEERSKEVLMQSTVMNESIENTMYRFVIHKHDASHLHYDLRLEHTGVLKSWAIPKGIPTKINIKRLAIQMPDHELSYINFEGEIEEGYGAGTVEIWDAGTYQNLHQDKNGKEISLTKSLRDGVLDIEFFGEKIKGRYTLIRMKQKHAKDAEWLITKVGKMKGKAN